jgi:hypothetical protein
VRTSRKQLAFVSVPCSAAGIIPEKLWGEEKEEKKQET